MSSIDDEILDIEKFIKTLELNDETYKVQNAIIKDGMEKGLIFDFINSHKAYRGTMVSQKVIKQEEYNDFQKYIDLYEEKEYNKFKKWRQDIIDSGIEFSKDELKYVKLVP